MQHLDQRPHRALDAIIKRRRAANEQQVLRVFDVIDGGDGDFQALGPLHALAVVDAPRVLLTL